MAAVLHVLLIIMLEEGHDFMGECAEIHQAGANIRTFHLLGGTG